jgi:seryl-tRNA synthetase
MPLPPVSNNTNVRANSSVNQLNEARNNALTTLQDVLSVLGSKNPELQAQLKEINQKLAGLDVDLDAAISKAEKTTAKTNQSLASQIPSIKAAVNESLNGLQAMGGQPVINHVTVHEGKIAITHDLHWSEDPAPLTARISEAMAKKFPGVEFYVQGNGLE